MRTLFVLAAGLAALTGSAMAVPNPAVEVRFVEPERYTDAENRFGSGIGLEATLSVMRRLIDEAASRVLSPGQRLVVEVLDIDLAGYSHPGANVPYGLRVVSDVAPPAFRLRYVLTSGGRRIASGEERVSDINFLLGVRAAQSGSFPYERELLRDWARRRFADRR